MRAWAYAQIDRLSQTVLQKSGEVDQLRGVVDQFRERRSQISARVQWDITLPLLLILALVSGYSADASGPAAPQAQQQPGQSITLEVDPHDNLFVDPQWSTGGQGTCRYLTNPSSFEWFVPIGSQAEWQSMENANDNQYFENYAAQQVCCRPAAAADSFCPGGAVVSVGDVAGSGSGGYGQLGSAGTANAQCKDANGTYTETHSYSCTVTGSGVSADGLWQFASNQGDVCTSANITTYGTCSTAGVGGWGNQLATVTNCLGQIVSQGYTGPACYTTPPCTTDYEKTGCSGSTAVYTDEGTCHSGAYTVPGGCTFVSESVGGGSCSYGVPNYSPGGYGGPTSTTYYEFLDCGGGAESTWTYWGTMSGAGVSCSLSSTDNEPWTEFVNGAYFTSGFANGPDELTCTYSGWQ